MENSFMQYKIPARVDIGHIRVEFESSYEPNGPFGAKSIGEVVINTVMASATTGNAGVVLTLLAVHGLGAATLESVCGSVV